MKRLNQNLFRFLAIFFLILPNLANSEDKFIYSYHVRVIDGDSIEIKKEKIRLFGIDAPAPFFVYKEFLGYDQHTAKVAHSPPKYNPSLLGFSNAPSMRGTLILQV